MLRSVTVDEDNENESDVITCSGCGGCGMLDGEECAICNGDGVEP